MHKAHLHNVLHKLCSPEGFWAGRKVGGGGAGGGVLVRCPRRQQPRGKGKAQDPRQGLLLALSVPTMAHPTATFPQASPGLVPGLNCPHAIPPPQGSPQEHLWDHSSRWLKACWGLPQGGSLLTHNQSTDPSCSPDLSILFVPSSYLHSVP